MMSENNCCLLGHLEPSDKHLLRLPELLRSVADFCGAVDLLVFSCVARACRDAAEGKQVWLTVCGRQLQPVLDKYFDGILPSLDPSLSWKRTYFAFRRTWKKLAQERTGRMLIQIAAQGMSGRGASETVPLLHQWPPRAKHYGVYDVTEFVHQHPGADQIIMDAATETDATDLFEAAAHSDSAVRRLSKLAVPGLEALLYDEGMGGLQTQVPLTKTTLCVFGAVVVAVLGLASGLPTQMHAFNSVQWLAINFAAASAVPVLSTALGKWWQRKHVATDT